MPSHWGMTHFPHFNSICAFTWKLRRHIYGCKKEPLSKVWNIEFLHSQQPFLLPGCRRWKLLICSSQGSPEEQCAGKNQNRTAGSFLKAASSRWGQQLICWEEGHEGYVLLMQLKLLNETHCSSNISQAGQEKKAGCHCIIPGTSGVGCFPELGFYQDSIFSLPSSVFGICLCR